MQNRLYINIPAQICIYRSYFVLLIRFISFSEAPPECDPKGV